MGPGEESSEKVTLVTLGPTGTCHERAAIEYMGFQGVEDFEIELIGIPSPELFRRSARV